MEKKYQVFVSSTYQDLIEERQKVIEALLGKNCFPVGMEYFPAANDDQFTVIKKLIDRCDYYILIIGGRYGSIEPKLGKSYTQLEFEYAVSKGIPVASFYHVKPDSLPGNKIEQTDTGKEKLKSFRKIVQAKLCDSWKEPYELAFKVNKSLDYMFENYPRTGWVNASEISSAEANKEILILKRENENLVRKITEIQITPPTGSEILQQGEDRIDFKINYYTVGEEEIEKLTYLTLTWNQLIELLCPYVIPQYSEKDLIIRMNAPLIEYLYEKEEITEELSSCKISDTDFQTIKVQFMALGIIQIILNEDKDTHWKITDYGYNLLIKLKALRRK